MVTNDNIDWELTEGLAHSMQSRLADSLPGLTQDHTIQQMIAAPTMQMAFMVRAAADDRERSRCIEVVNAVLQRAGLSCRLLVTDNFELG